MMRGEKELLLSMSLPKINLNYNITMSGRFKQQYQDFFKGTKMINENNKIKKIIKEKKYYFTEDKLMTSTFSLMI